MKQFKFKAPPGAGAVYSVFGRTGDVVANSADYSSFYVKVPVSKTVAQMQSLSGSYAPGQLYCISDALNLQFGVTWQGGLYVMAVDSTTLAKTGCGWFQNNAMSGFEFGFFDYTVDTDEISKVWTPFFASNNNKSNNVFYNAFNNGWADFPFDNINYYENTFDDPLIVKLDNDLYLSGNTFGYQCIIDFQEGATVINNAFGPGVAITVNTGTGSGPSSLSQIRADCGSIIQAVNGCGLAQCDFGPYKQFDTSAIARDYTATGKMMRGNVSTFEITNAQCANDELDMNVAHGNIDMANFKWAGVLWIMAHTGDDVATISNAPDGQMVTFRVDSNPGDDLVILDHDSIGGDNIYLHKSGDNITLTVTNIYIDYLTVIKSDNSHICEVASIARV